VSDRPTFYVDRCLGKAVAGALRVAGADVRVHDDHFAQAALDAEWIPEVSAKGWVILTKDKNIRRMAGEREAVLLSSARVITLSSGNMPGAEMAALFVGHLGEIERLAASHPPPFVAVLSPVGIQIVLPRPAPPSTDDGADPSSGDPEP
jgi:predicted nuclease of predicted toxin-antitoxin system